MKKMIAVAALFAAAFAAPALPVQAQSDYPDTCLILPLLKAECREIISDNIESGRSTVVAATITTAEVAADAVAWPVPLWWNCTPAPEGSGHLFDCE
jgi:hypothetical protein